MNFLPSIIPWKLVAVLGLIAALIAGEYYLLDRAERAGDAKATARYELALTKQKVAAARALADAKIEVAAAEKSLNDFKNTQEVKDAASTKTNLDQATRLRELAGSAGRLRDPNAPAGCGCGDRSAEGTAAASADPGAGDASKADGLLSGELTALLLKLTEEADSISAAYTSCRADAYAVRSTQ